MLISGNENPERIHLHPFKRLVELHRLISNKARPSLKTLAAKLGVTGRTVRRDISFMRDRLNAPIIYDAKWRGYVYSHENWEMPLVDLTEGELIAFLIATAALQAGGTTYEDDHLRRALSKIINSLPEGLTVSLGYLFETTSFQAPAHVNADTELLRQIYRATHDRQTIEFDYTSPHSGKTTHRRCDPLHLHNHEGTWYLIAYDQMRKDFRDFHLARLDSLAMTKNYFEPPKHWKKDEYIGAGFGMYRGGKKTNVEIVFDEFQAQWMRERTCFHPGETREELSDGRLRLQFTVGENGLEAVARFCMQYAGNCVAVKPKKLREIIVKKLRKGMEEHR